jgi:hypothetical protein
VFVLSAVLYYISIRLTVRVVSTDYNSARQHINSIPQIASQVLFSYKQVMSYFTSRVDYLPRALKWMPGLSIALGLGFLLVSRWRAGIRPFVLGVLLILAIPPVLQLSFVINSKPVKRRAACIRTVLDPKPTFMHLHDYSGGVS